MSVTRIGSAKAQFGEFLSQVVHGASHAVRKRRPEVIRELVDVHCRWTGSPQLPRHSNSYQQPIFINIEDEYLLETKWTFWFDKYPGPGLSVEQYTAALRNLGTVGTIQVSNLTILVVICSLILITLALGLLAMV